MRAVTLIVILGIALPNCKQRRPPVAQPQSVSETQGDQAMLAQDIDELETEAFDLAQEARKLFVAIRAEANPNAELDSDIDGVQFETSARGLALMDSETGAGQAQNVMVLESMRQDLRAEYDQIAASHNSSNAATSLRRLHELNNRIAALNAAIANLRGQQAPRTATAAATNRRESKKVTLFGSEIYCRESANGREATLMASGGEAVAYHTHFGQTGAWERCLRALAGIEASDGFYCDDDAPPTAFSNVYHALLGPANHVGPFVNRLSWSACHEAVEKGRRGGSPTVCVPYMRHNPDDVGWHVYAVDRRTRRSRRVEGHQYVTLDLCAAALRSGQ